MHMQKYCNRTSVHMQKQNPMYYVATIFFFIYNQSILKGYLGDPSTPYLAFKMKMKAIPFFMKRQV